MYEDIAANKRKTAIMLAVFVAFISLVVFVVYKFIGGSLQVFYAGLVVAFLYAVVSYYAGSRLSLAINSAKEIQKKDNPRLWRTIENLAITDGLPMPRVFIMNDSAPNAFATGRDPQHAAVCVTTGLLEIMDDNELQGVLAHELGHVKNYDIRVSMIAFALTAVISLIADIIINMSFLREDDRDNSGLVLILGIVAAILAPLIASLIQLAISRQREYLADATSALTTRYPEGLESALAKIGQTGSALSRQNTATAHFFFANPLRGHSATNLFSTHPPIADRIARLKKMDAEAPDEIS